MITRSAAAFSVVELISAVCITAILAAVTIPSIAKVRGLRENVACLSNLRQIGLGIALYANDNQGRLPGPLFVGQYPYLNNTTQLSTYLADYLHLDKTRTKFGHKDVFVCPGYKRAVRKVGDAPVYRMNVKVPMRDLLDPAQPFGYPNSYDSDIFGPQPDFPVMQVARLSEIVDENGNPARGSTWAMKDIDQADPTLESLGLALYALYPPGKVHGKHRNALFFDFHVGPVDVTE